MPTPDLEAPIATWDIPLTSNETLAVQVRPGQVLTIVGSNGSGKSALATWMAERIPDQKLRRVLAQRKLWFSQSGPAISPADRESFGPNLEYWNKTKDSRYLDHADARRSDIALFDLLGALNDENRRVAELYDSGASRDQVESQVGMRLLITLNQALMSAGLKIELHVTERQTFFVRNRDLQVDYPIFHMSDGEKSALLLAAEVLTAPPRSIIMIDEPERHLHRAISARLVEAIVTTRQECAFVVLTHDLDLASKLVSYSGATYSVAGVEWTAEDPSRWAIHKVEPDDSLPEEARKAILGGRQRVLFIEGKQGSLDLELYRLLFPDWQLVPVGGCDLVIRSVTGLRESEGHHWISPAGIVDRDGRSEEECNALKSRGIYPLPVSEIENFYYARQVIDSFIAKQALMLGVTSEEMFTNARQAILSELAIPGTLPRLARKLALDDIARSLVSHMPSNPETTQIAISFPSPYARILHELEELLGAGDVDGLMRAVPIRNTGVRGRLATALRLPSAADYQSAARVCIAEDQRVADSLRESIGLSAAFEQN